MYRRYTRSLLSQPPIILCDWHPTIPADEGPRSQLAAKIEVLQERLNEKREQLLERHLVLDEVSHLRCAAVADGSARDEMSHQP